MVLLPKNNHLYGCADVDMCTPTKNGVYLFLDKHVNGKLDKNATMDPVFFVLNLKTITSIAVLTYTCLHKEDYAGTGI